MHHQTHIWYIGFVSPISKWHSIFMLGGKRLSQIKGICNELPPLSEFIGKIFVESFS